jgi:cbb3-type cytochrome oxidase cytochrome c subunit
LRELPQLNGVGDELGPALNGVRERHDRSWIEHHFAEPPNYSPDSIMPAFQFKPDELKLLTDYVLAIPK